MVAFRGGDVLALLPAYLRRAASIASRHAPVCGAAAGFWCDGTICADSVDDESDMAGGEFPWGQRWGRAPLPFPPGGFLFPWARTAPTGSARAFVCRVFSAPPCFF